MSRECVQQAYGGGGLGISKSDSVGQDQHPSLSFPIWNVGRCIDLTGGGGQLARLGPMTGSSLAQSHQHTTAWDLLVPLWRPHYTLPPRDQKE